MTTTTTTPTTTSAPCVAPRRRLATTPLARVAGLHGWLAADAGAIRCPLLVKGRLVGPPEVARAAIDLAFAALDRDRAATAAPAGHVLVGGAQVLRHAELDRRTLRPTGRWIYRVMPVVDPLELPERDLDRLSAELYDLPSARIADWLRAVRGALEADLDLVHRVRELERATSEHPDAFVDAAFAAFPIVLGEEHGAAAVDLELAHDGVPGRRLLDEWVELSTPSFPGPAHAVGAAFVSPAFARELATHRSRLRALPTRQLHVTAGNSPLIPLFSLLRAVWTKSACVLKLPGGAALPGSLIALAAATAAPDHPLTRHLSMVYWRGGDDEVERVLFAPGAFDRIVVWGEPEAVVAVKQRAGLTKTLCFNPRYGASFIGRAALADPAELDEVATRAVFDSMIENQKACIASLVHYVEGTVADAERYAAAVSRALVRWDAAVPNPLLDRHRGQLKRLERGLLLDARVAYHRPDGELASGVIVVPHEFAIKDHPMCRLVIVRPVASLDAALGYLHPGVATVGVYPEPRRAALRDRIAARGVSNVVPLGHAGCAAIGAAHDGMRVLAELVDWKNG